MQLGWAWSESGQGMDPSIPGSTQFGNASTNLLLQLAELERVETARRKAYPEWVSGWEEIGNNREWDNPADRMRVKEAKDLGITYRPGTRLDELCIARGFAAAPAAP